MIEVKSESCRAILEDRYRAQHARMQAKRVSLRRLSRAAEIGGIVTFVLGVLSILVGAYREGVWLVVITSGLALAAASTRAQLRPAFDVRRWEWAKVGDVVSSALALVAVAYYVIFM